MNNLHTQKTEEKSIQTEDQPKIANLQVESQNQNRIDYKDESKLRILQCMLLKNIQLSIITILLKKIHLYLNICTHLNMWSTHGLQIHHQSTVSFYIQTTY